MVDTLPQKRMKKSFIIDCLGAGTVVCRMNVSRIDNKKKVNRFVSDIFLLVIYLVVRLPYTWLTGGMKPCRIYARCILEVASDSGSSHLTSFCDVFSSNVPIRACRDHEILATRSPLVARTKTTWSLQVELIWIWERLFSRWLAVTLWRPCPLWRPETLATHGSTRNASDPRVDQKG